jgi:NADH-quinone oxidoreductase subunit L
MSHLVWLVPVFPLIGFALLGLVNRGMSKGAAGIVGSGSILASFLLATAIFMEKFHSPQPEIIQLFDWFHAGAMNVKFSFLVDPLSCLFMMIITGIGFLIHVYSSGYMHDDEGFRRFFAYLNLFVFFMLLLVLGDNFLVMFVGWEGVGLCSYLLIGFWYKNIDYSSAAKKAFVMNRIGDLGFLLGILYIYSNFGGIDYATVFAHPEKVSVGVLTTITMLLFVGAMGKSAQLPLYTWLPDAMAGPTPVSALIHAATMVTAGIYMVARANPLFALAPITLQFVAWVGIITSLLAASIGFLQNDIKKVLAYSTVSQLGLMFVGLGVGATTGAVFHVMTHAFFKALLFLGAGSVIHAMSGDQDIRNMGGLRSKLGITHATFLAGFLAIIGFPFTSGYFSKDEILVGAWEHDKILGVLSIGVALMTAFYMSRVYFLTFWGKFRGTHEQEHHLHESPYSMTLPLIVLAVLSLVGGVFKDFMHHKIAPMFKGGEGHIDANFEMTFALIVSALVLAVVGFAAYMYIGKEKLAKGEEELSGVGKLIFNKYKIDELYTATVTKPLDGLSKWTNHFVEKHGIDGGVNSLGPLVRGLSNVIRSTQKGSVDVYFFAMVVAVIVVIAVKLVF